MGSAHNFQRSQIVCLEHEGDRLYAEVIQIVESRQLCWARPLMLALSLSCTDSEPKQIHLYDLRQGSDLLWPLPLFRPALDTEVVPLLVELQSPKTETESDQVAHQQLQLFIRKIWQAHPDNFQ